MLPKKLHLYLGGLQWWSGEGNWWRTRDKAWGDIAVICRSNLPWKLPRNYAGKLTIERVAKRTSTSVTIHRQYREFWMVNGKRYSYHSLTTLIHQYLYEIPIGQRIYVECWYDA